MSAQHIERMQNSVSEWDNWNVEKYWLCTTHIQFIIIRQMSII
jgi:hypothetical protein